jgi:hypothetical protein
MRGEEEKEVVEEASAVEGEDEQGEKEEEERENEDKKREGEEEKEEEEGKEEADEEEAGGVVDPLSCAQMDMQRVLCNLRVVVMNRCAQRRIRKRVFCRQR